MNNMSDSRKEKTAFFLIKKFEMLFPEFEHDLNIDDLVDKLDKIKYCQISGRIFRSSNKSDIYIAPILPFNHKMLVTIERVAFICKDAKRFYRKIFEYIIENPNSENTEQFRDMKLIFNTTRNVAIEKNNNKTKNEQSDFTDEPLDYEQLIAKASIKTSNDLRRQNLSIIRKEIEEPFKLVNSRFQNIEIDVFPESVIRFKIRRCQQRSLDKGLSCNMTFENTKDIFLATHCALTGMLLDKGPNNSEPKVNTFSIDRINRFEGYNIHNIMVLCHEANKIKGNLEKRNYSESIEQITNILQKTKKLVIEQHQRNPNLQFTKSKKINKIIADYESRKQKDDSCRCAF